jgi:hypothetical protein
MLEPMLHKPKNVSTRNTGRLIVLIGIAAMLFIIAANQIESVAIMMTSPDAVRP